MNVVDGGALFLNFIVWVGVAIALAVGFTYLLRPQARERFPGGAQRYVGALIVQSAAFMIPIPVALFLLIGVPLPTGVDVLIAVTAGVVVLAALHYLPLTGPLLRDLRKARLDESLERASRRPK